MTVIFSISLFALYYVYDGYLRILQILSMLKHSPFSPRQEQKEFPAITVLLTVFNEENKIRPRINNILETTYPPDRLEVIVASDGSTDDTDSIVSHYGDNRVRLFRPLQRNGKTDTQNKAIAVATGDIVIFSDADTKFDKGFLRNITMPFSDLLVGGVDGHLLFQTNTKSGVSLSQGFYWEYELRLRSLESDLGILAVASGGCLAIRRELFRTMPPTIGEDCIVPLDVVLQGYRMIHANNALAYDIMDHESTKELRTRIRMTLRNWQGTWSRPALLNPFRYPSYSFSLCSHKLVRWLSPVFLLLATICATILALRGSTFFRLVSLGFVAFYAVGMIGWLAEVRGKRVPLVRTVYSFLLAQLGFLIGVWKAIRGVNITAYRQ